VSDLICEIRELSVDDHPDAERLDIVRPLGTEYVCVSQKGLYRSGDKALYIGEGAIVPESLLRHGFWDPEAGKGMLAGSKGDRVKAIRLRGVLSQGILFPESLIQPMSTPADLGRNWADILGVTKYVPPIPEDLAGKVYACDSIRGYTEIANEKAAPALLRDGEYVIATEKIHGSCCVIHIARDGLVHVSSKGMAKKGLAIEMAEGNAYWRMVAKYNLAEAMRKIQAGFSWPGKGEAVTLYGEVYGPGVQDLHYGEQDKAFRAFDLRVGSGDYSEWIEYEQFLDIMDLHDIPAVPILFEGRYDRDRLYAVANEKKSVLDAKTLREGLVVRAVPERRDIGYGRALVKIVSERYLTRKGGTEHE
jgi:RNA ligase (TIGR02306 family)